MVRTRRLAEYFGISGSGGVVLTTVPADRTALVKDITLQNRSGSAATLRLLLRTSVGDIKVLEVVVPALETRQSSGRQVVAHAGDSLLVHTDPLGVAVAVQVSGALLQGLPS